MSRTLQKVRNIYKEEGILKALKKIFTRAFTKLKWAVYRKEEEIVISWDLHNDAQFQQENEIQIEEITSENLSEIRAFLVANDIPNVEFLDIKNYIKAGYLGFAARIDGELIGHIWCRGNSAHQLHPHQVIYKIPTQDDELYMFHNKIANNYLGNSNSTKFLYKVREALKTKGFNRAKAIVGASNTPAKWLYRIHGWEFGKAVTSHRFLKTFVLEQGSIYFIKNRWKTVALF